MNERLNLQDLIDLLSKKQDITKKDAEAFLRELIAVISENIENNEPVKIKDFGVFKLVKVNARKSVNVNTGEAIEIPAHYKLSFTPDKTLKEMVNKPFAHFESVVIEDGVNFDNIEKGEEEPEEIEDTENESTENISSEEPNEAEIISTTEPEKEDENRYVPENMVADQDQPIHPIQPISEPSVDIQEENEEQGEEPETSTDSDVAVETHNEEPSTSAENPKEKEDDDDDDELHYDNGSGKKKTIIILFIIAALIGIGVYFKDDISALIHSKENKEAILKEKENIMLLNQKAIEDSIALSKQLTDSIQVKDSLLTEKTADMNQKPTTEPKKDTSSKADPKKPLGSVMIESGHTLRNISLKYYGHKSFWIYIYEENKSIIENPNRIPINTKLILPAPEKYGIDAKNAAVVEKAKKAESKLIREMGL